MSRLIDADDLIDGYKHMGYNPTEFEEESYQEGWCKGFNAAVEHCISHVIHAPTVEPQRIKGRWIHDGYDIPHGVDWMHCSVCGRREPHVPAAMTNFCPTCGSDMRGDEDAAD